jgi:hypothetical protein
MHKDYAIEVYKKLKYPKYVEPISDISILKVLLNDELIDFAELQGDEKIASICQHLKECIGYRNNSKFSTHKKMTENQKLAVANFLIGKFDNLKTVIAQAFGIAEEYIDNYHL